MAFLIVYPDRPEFNRLLISKTNEYAANPKYHFQLGDFKAFVTEQTIPTHGWEAEASASTAVSTEELNPETSVAGSVGVGGSSANGAGLGNRQVSGDGVMIAGSEKSDELRGFSQKLGDISMPVDLDTRIGSLRQEFEKLELAVHAGTESKTVPGENEEAHQRELRQLAEKSFDLRQQLQRLELQRLKLKVQEIENNLAIREKSRDSIIDRRLGELIESLRTPKALSPDRSDGKRGSVTQSAGWDLQAAYELEANRGELWILSFGSRAGDSVHRFQGAMRLQRIDQARIPMWSPIGCHVTTTQMNRKCSFDVNLYLFGHRFQLFIWSARTAEQPDQFIEVRGF